jgi:hypothetical protein
MGQDLANIGISPVFLIDAILEKERSIAVDGIAVSGHCRNYGFFGIENRPGIIDPNAYVIITTVQI